jgi:hypothetical protein
MRSFSKVEQGVFTPIPRVILDNADILTIGEGYQPVIL